MPHLRFGIFNSKHSQCQVADDKEIVSRQWGLERLEEDISSSLFIQCIRNVSVETTKLIGSLNSTVTMINETIIGLVVCKLHIRRAFGWISHAQLIGL